MSYCVARETGYPCANPNRLNTVYIKPIEEDELAPVRDPPKPLRDLPCEIHEPNPPPKPSTGDWELQYCKWSGWTWVKKTDLKSKNCSCTLPEPIFIQQERPRQHETKKKNGGCFSCFKKNKHEPPPRPAVVNVSAQAIPSLPKIRDDTDTCRCCCCCCCAMEVECRCCGDEEPLKRKFCKTIETQTHREMKEQATKTSDTSVTKQRVCVKRKRCCCRRPVCCRCVRNSCCPCVQNVCCSCQNDNNRSSVSETAKQKSNEQIYKLSATDQLINYCLQNGLNKPKLKPATFSTNNNTLHKSLELLLRNNINITNLFTEKKDQLDLKPLSCFSSNHTISCLSSDKIVRKSDAEHANLLTAVCDAILSNHKLDGLALHNASSKSTHKSCCESKSSKDSLNHTTAGTGLFLEKLLNETNFCTRPREIGVQAGTTRKLETQPKRSFTKLFKKRSRILAAPRFPRQVEALRRTSDTTKNATKRISVKKTDQLSDLLKSRKCDCGSKSSKQVSIEAVLNSLDLVNGESKPEIDLLEQTSPPFTDLDLVLSSEERKSR